MSSKYDIFTKMNEDGLFDYGSVIPAKHIRRLFDIKEVEYPAMRHEITEVALQELSAITYIKNRLLNDGKYIKSAGEHYRILLPSENAEQVLTYMNAADNKLKRGIKLNANTPLEYRINSNDEVRAMMKMS